MGLPAPIKWHFPGFNQLRRDPAVADELLRRGQAIADAAGGEPDFVVIAEPTRSRARVVVVTATPQAMEDEANYMVLTRALDAGRD